MIPPEFDYEAPTSLVDAIALLASDPDAKILAGGQAAPQPAMATDPVCGMQVEIATAHYTSQHAGQDYYFCALGCQHSFEKNPASYVTVD